MAEHKKSVSRAIIERKRRRSRGQSALLGAVASLIALGSLMGVTLWLREQSIREERAITLAQELDSLSERVSKYVASNYNAIAQTTLSSSNGMSFFAISCNNNTTGKSCTFPSIRTQNWQSLSQSQYIRPEKTNNNIASQQYVVAFKAIHQYDKTFLSGILTTTGPMISDDQNHSIANNTKLVSSFIPTSDITVKTPHTNAPWLLSNNRWDGLVTPGHVTVVLTPLINTNTNNGAITRYNNTGTSETTSSDVSQQTLHRPLYFGTDSSDGKSASICFCTNPTTGGTYEGACTPTAKITNTQYTNTCTKPAW